MTDRGQKKKPICPECNGDEILMDAWASWDSKSQSWELHQVFDNGYCETCGGETTPEFIAIDPDPTR